MIGHDAFDRNPEIFKPGQGALCKRNGAVGQAGDIIDRAMRTFPSGASFVALSAAIAGDAVADAAWLFHVQLDDLTRLVALIADDFGLGVERGKLAQAELAEDGTNRGSGGRPSCRAIAGPLRRWRRSCSIRVMVSALVWCGASQRNACRCDGPAARAACFTGQPWWTTLRTSKARPCGVRWAFLCTFIRGSRKWG